MLNLPAGYDFENKMLYFNMNVINEQIFDAQKKVIRKYGEHGNCVIVGRNANSILSQFDDSLHVFIHADKYWRVQRLKNDQMKDQNESKITQELEKIDKMRQKYCSYYTKTEFGTSKYYDLCLNTSKISIDECVNIICNLAR